MFRADEVRNPMRDHAGLPAARARQNQNRAFGSFYSFTLLGIETREKVHYRTIFALVTQRILIAGANAMDVHFTPDVEAKLEQLARDSGCRTDELVVDAVRCHIDGLAYVREMLDRRYDDLDSGRVKPIDGEEAFQRLMEKTEAGRRRLPA